MSEPTRKRMLQVFDEMRMLVVLAATMQNPEAEDSDFWDITNAIHRLIENSPRVTREFVIRKANEYNLPHFWLFQFVRELGCKVENEEK